MMPKRSNTRRPRKNGKALVRAITALGEKKEEFPASFSGTMTYPVIVRYVVTSTTPTLSITRGNILNMLVCAVSATSAARLWGSVKINRIKIWQATQATAPTGSFTGVQLEWLSEYGPERVFQDSGNVMRPAHLASRPPTQSLASFWSTTGTGESVALFRLSGQSFSGNAGTTTPLLVGTIIDLHLAATIQDDEGPTLTTVAGASTGQVYIRSLDGTVGNYTPVSYSTI